MPKHIIAMWIDKILPFLVSASMLFSGCSGTEKVNKINDEFNSQVVSENALQVHFVDVGQADCEIIKLPDGQFAVIDSGDRAHKDDVMAYLKALGVDDISFIVATHGHEDHIGGMQSILENYDVKKFIRPYQDYDSVLYTNMLYAIEENGANEIIAKYGDIFEVGGVEFEIFGPINQEYDDHNDCSVVIKMTYKDRSFLFTGDAGKDAEKDMVSMNYDLKSDVLKVGHHGSRTASTEKFIKEVDPSISIVSVGKDNKYGLPDEEPLERLENIGSKVYRTDQVGTVVVTTDGENINISYGDQIENIIVQEENKEFKIEENEQAKTDEVVEEEVSKGAFIGNSNTKVYHDENCGTLPDEKNRVIFSSKEEAEKSGYRPHKNCVDKK